MISLDLKLVRHLMASPGQVWTTSELANIFNRPERTIRRTAAKLITAGIAIRISGGIALDPFIVNALRANITRLRNIKEKLKRTENDNDK